MSAECYYLSEPHGIRPPAIHLRDGMVLSIVMDDGPRGACGQGMATTSPHTVIHVWESEREYREWRTSENIHRQGKNVRERVVVVGDWSSPGPVSLVLHKEEETCES